LLPEGRSDQLLIDSIFSKIKEACEELAVTLIGGHTEITRGLDRPIIVGTMIGEVSPERLITPEGAQPGDVILLTKGVPLEAASILARECAQDLSHLDKRLLSRARDYLTDPGISVVEEALTAASVGGVTAMHDPTEGGLSAALWEMSDAAKIGLEINPEAVPILPEAALICQSLHIAPFEAIASGALLLAVRSESVDAILSALRKIEIPVHVIGRVTDKIGVYMRKENKVTDLPRPSRDALAVFFEKHPIGNSPSENHEG
jgi:hydrogenase maturation factor